MDTDLSYQWPEVFKDPSLIPQKQDVELVAAALCAWGLCQSGFAHKAGGIPPTFGETMVRIRNQVNMPQPPTPQGFFEFSEKFITDKS